MTFAPGITGLLVIDPYNDFISEGGKVWDRLKGVAEANSCIPHMKQVLDAAREADIRVFYALHRRYRPGDYETWKYIAPIQKAAWDRKTFEFGTWGGELRAEFQPQPGDIVAQEHWCSSGFANTDLDLLLKKHGIHELIVIGLIAHTCVEATVRYGAELGYQVTVVKDATASYSDDHMHAALEVNLPNYAAVVSTEEVVEAIRDRPMNSRTRRFLLSIRKEIPDARRGAGPRRRRSRRDVARAGHRADRVRTACATRQGAAAGDRQPVHPRDGPGRGAADGTGGPGRHHRLRGRDGRQPDDRS